jgi:hypothetical protein
MSSAGVHAPSTPSRAVGGRAPALSPRETASLRDARYRPREFSLPERLRDLRAVYTVLNFTNTAEAMNVSRDALAQACAEQGAARFTRSSVEWIRGQAPRVRRRDRGDDAGPGDD